MAEPGPDENEGQLERSSQFLDQNDMNPRYRDFLIAQARTKFPEKLEAVLRKYGAFEYELSEDRMVRFICSAHGYRPKTCLILQEVLDVVPPEGYIEHIDQREMERWASGDVGALNLSV